MEFGKGISCMEKKNIDWSNLGFAYMQTDKRYVSIYKDGQWDEGRLTEDATVTINESAGVLQYAQTCFEGLKAYTTEDGHIVCFRPDLNAERMMNTCKRLMMPVFPKDRFLDAVEQVVRANAAYVPPYGSGATLYIRPYLFGSGPVIGVAPAPEYTFRLFCTPVGPYFKGGAKPIKLCVSDYDRAAPHGTGHIKAGLNYAMSLYAGYEAHDRGFNENLYLDAATRTKVEETGGANFLFVTKDGKVVTPKSPSILPSITRRSLMVVARDILGLECEEREVYFSELRDFAECGLCGTAAVISPVGLIDDHGTEIRFPSGMDKMGPVTRSSTTPSPATGGTHRGAEGMGAHHPVKIRGSNGPDGGIPVRPILERKGKTMEFNEMVHATIAACFHVRLTGAFGERGRMAFLHATRCYAEQRGRRMAQRAIRDGVEVLDWGAYLRYGEWENTGDAKRLGCANQKEVLSLSPDYVIRITSCPWHARFAQLGLTQAGRDYCRDLDRSIARGFNPDLVFELKCTLHDGPCCVQAMRGADFAPGQEHPPRQSRRSAQL